MESRSFNIFRRCITEPRTREIAEEVIKEEFQRNMSKVCNKLSPVYRSPLFAQLLYVSVYSRDPMAFGNFMLYIIASEVFIMCAIGGYQWYKKRRIRKAIW